MEVCFFVSFVDLNLRFVAKLQIFSFYNIVYYVFLTISSDNDMQMFTGTEKGTRIATKPSTFHICKPHHNFHSMIKGKWPSHFPSIKESFGK